MKEKHLIPIYNAYWVVPGKILAGGYPFELYREKVRPMLYALLKHGITFFINLTEEGEKGLPPYSVVLQEEASKLAITAVYRRMSIPDFDIPSQERMQDIIETIDDALSDGHKVYIHCFAGIGRTGTVAGCYLAHHGFDGEKALEELERLKQGTPFETDAVPITPEQRQMVQNWRV